MENQGNPWGQPASARLDWTKPLPFEVQTVAAWPPAGAWTSSRSCTGSAARPPSTRATRRSPGRSRRACTPRACRSRSSARRSRAPAIRRAGWATTTSSRCSRSGNVETLDQYRMGERTIVTACPHCFNSLGNEYGQLGGNYRVVHHCQYLAELRVVRAAGDAAGGRRSRRPATTGRGPSPSTTRATWPATTASWRRRGTCWAPPGVSVTEMEKSGKQTFCCGAGGGRMWMEEDRGTRINAERTRQVLETGAETVATACPFCMVMLSDGLAAAARRARRQVDRHGYQRGPAARLAASRRSGACRSSEARGSRRPGSAGGSRRAALPAGRAGRVGHEVADPAVRAALHALGADRERALAARPRSACATLSSRGSRAWPRSRPPAAAISSSSPVVSSMRSSPIRATDARPRRAGQRTPLDRADANGRTDRTGPRRTQRPRRRAARSPSVRRRTMAAGDRRRPTRRHRTG